MNASSLFKGVIPESMSNRVGQGYRDEGKLNTDRWLALCDWNSTAGESKKLYGVI